MIRSLLMRLVGPYLTEAQRHDLEQAAEACLCAGVTPTLAEWRAFAPVERSAWLEASARVEAARAARVGIASSSPRAAMAVAAKADGGAALREFDRNAQTAALHHAASELRSRYGGE